MAPKGAFPDDAAIAFYLALAMLMLFARGLGELARMLKQPAVLGEILAGVILGKTILGRVWPVAWKYMFGPGLQLTAISSVSSLAATLFMLVAGLEMDLDRIIADRKRPVIIGFCSVAVPFAWGFGITYGFPEAMGSAGTTDKLIYAFFAGTAFSITAMPVVAKTLRDVGLYRSQLGQAVMSAATIDDLIGWSLFAVVLSLANPGSSVIPGIGVGGVIGLSIAYVVFVLVFGKLAFPRFFLWIQATFSFPGGILGFVIAWTLLMACGGKLIGLHNTLGAFLVGASLSNNKYLRSSTKEVIDLFVSYCFAPIFFGFIAISADFVADFDAALVAIVMVIACVGKFMGATFGAKVTGSSWRESFALATCMNSRGAMEILLANVALNAGIIDGRMYVALIFMAIATSLMPGPILRRVLRRKERKIFTMYMPSSGGFVHNLQATSMELAVKELCTSIRKADAAEPLIAQETSLPTGNHDQLAVLAIHLEGIRRTTIAVGVSLAGIDFSGEFGYAGNHPQLANIVVVILFPPKAFTKGDVTLEDDLIQQICLVFNRQAFRNEFVRLKKYLEVLHLINMETHRLGLHSTIEEGLGPPVVNPAPVRQQADENMNAESLTKTGSSGSGDATGHESNSAAPVSNPDRQEGTRRDDRQMDVV